MQFDYYLIAILVLVFDGTISAYNILHFRSKRKQDRMEQATADFYGSSYSLSVVMSGIGHELSSPLIAIGGLLTRLEKRIKRGVANEEEISKILRLSLEQYDAMANLLSDLRGLTKLQTRKNFVPTKLKSLIENILNSFVHAYPNIKFLTELDQIEPVRVIPHHIMLLLSHVIRNSVEAIGKGKTGEISVQLHRWKWKKCGCLPGNKGHWRRYQVLQRVENISPLRHGGEKRWYRFGLVFL